MGTACALVRVFEMILRDGIASSLSGLNLHALQDIRSYTLTAAVVLLVNTVVLWVLFRFLGIVLAFVALRSTPSDWWASSLRVGGRHDKR